MMNCWDPSAHTTWADEMEEICAENDCEDQNQTQEGFFLISEEKVFFRILINDSDS
jgi:hypothetical protein